MSCNASQPGPWTHTFTFGTPRQSSANPCSPRPLCRDCDPCGFWGLITWAWRGCGCSSSAHPFLVAISPFSPFSGSVSPSSVAGAVRRTGATCPSPAGGRVPWAENAGMRSAWPGAARGAAPFLSSFFPDPQARRDVVTEIGHTGKVLLPACLHWLWGSFEPSSFDAGSSARLTRVSKRVLCRPLAHGQTFDILTAMSYLTCMD